MFLFLDVQADGWSTGGILAASGRARCRGTPSLASGGAPGAGRQGFPEGELPPRAQWQGRPVSLLSRGGWGFSWSLVREGQGLCWKSRLSTGLPGVVHARGLVAFCELKALGCCEWKSYVPSPRPKGRALCCPRALPSTPRPPLCPQPPPS